MTCRSFRAAATLAAVVAVLTACGDGSPTSEGRGTTSVLLTDAPFPYDLVARVDVHIEKIEASATKDTTDLTRGWVTLAAPDRTFNLLDLQNGTTALLGEAQVPAATYQAMRMTLNTEKSSITTKSGGRLEIDWQSSHGRPTLYAFIEAPMDVGAGGSIVIDFDVGRSFLCPGASCTNVLTFSPWFRAVNAAATGSVSGTVSGENASGTTAPIGNTAITVYRADESLSQFQWSVAATGKTDEQGRFKVAYLMPGTYNLRADAPRGATLTPAIRRNVVVAAGNETAAQNISLARSGPATIDLEVTRSTIAVFDTAFVRAIVTSGGADDPFPTIDWSSSNQSVLLVHPWGTARASVYGVAPGTATITAAYKGRTATATFVVTAPGPREPVASVQLSPATATAFVGDSVGFVSTLKDAAGRTLIGRPTTWTSSDPAVASILIGGSGSAVLRAHRAGSATITATSEGRQGSASLTVAARP